MSTPNETVFLLREEEALKTLLSGITVWDGKSNARPVKVWFNQPDVEVKAVTYPYILIDLVDVMQSKERQVGGGIVYDYDLNGQVPLDTDVYSYEQPILYDLFYQITTYARHPRHDRELLRQMMKFKTPGKWGSLPVYSADGGDLQYKSMFVEGFVKRDAITDDRRLYRNTITVRILSEMTQETAQNAMSVVHSVRLNADTTGIPDGLTPITLKVITQ